MSEGRMRAAPSIIFAGLGLCCLKAIEAAHARELSTAHCMRCGTDAKRDGETWVVDTRDQESA